jgi:hypothetical protein
MTTVKLAQKSLFAKVGFKSFARFKKSSKYERKNDHTNENELFLKNLTNKKHKLIGLVYIINNKKILEKNKFNLGGKNIEKIVHEIFFKETIRARHGTTLLAQATMIY